jgi:CheY-like chemotaxis protein
MERPPKILIVEDDPLQMEFIVPELQNAFCGTEIKLLKTEHQFRVALEEIAKNPPDVAIIDVMLRWTDPVPNQPPAPEDVREGGHYQAGLRCAALLRRYETTRAIPVILYTVLEEADLLHDLRELNNVRLLTKESDIGPLIEMIGQVTQA